MRFHCATCGLQVTQDVALDDKWTYSYCVPFEDMMNTVMAEHAIAGCCGWSHCDGANVVCTKGHDLGVRVCDCWLGGDHGVFLDKCGVTSHVDGQIVLDAEKADATSPLRAECMLALDQWVVSFKFRRNANPGMTEGCLHRKCSPEMFETIDTWLGNQRFPETCFRIADEWSGPRIYTTLRVVDGHLAIADGVWKTITYLFGLCPSTHLWLRCQSDALGAIGESIVVSGYQYKATNYECLMSEVRQGVGLHVRDGAICLE